MTTQSCMGGWCTRRDRCPNYYAASEAQEPSQRLCPNGAEVVGGPPAQPAESGEEQAPAVEVPKARQPHVAAGDRLAQIMALLTPDGVETDAIVKALGFTTRSRPSVLLRQLVADGRAFETGSGNTAKRYFPTAESRDAYAAAYRAEMASRRLINCKHASQRYREALNPALRKRPPRGQPKPEKVAKPAGRTPSKWQDTPVAASPVRTASQPQQQVVMDLSKAKITLIPTPPDRYAVTAVAPVVSSRECRPWAEAVTA